MESVIECEAGYEGVLVFARHINNLFIVGCDLAEILRECDDGLERIFLK